MRHFVSRLRIRALGLAVRLIPAPVPFMFTGPGSSERLCVLMADSGVRSAMVVTDAILLKLGVLDPILDALAGAGVVVEIFAEVAPDPTTAIVMDGVARLRACGADAVLAVGGGSSMDAAKAIVACHANGSTPGRLEGYFKVRRQGPAFYAAPTTAGTGSEVTIASVVSDPVARRKFAIVDGKLVPAAIALDPALMVGLPPAVTGATGMDALTHAIESYLSTLATPKTRAMSKAAARAILRDLVPAYDDGRDMRRRESLAVASCLAGLAFTRTGVGYVHAIAHQFGALYHVPHGVANATVLPYVLEQMLDAAAGPLADLARHAGLADDGASDDAAARVLIEEVRRMNARMGISATLDRLVRSDIPDIVKRAFDEAHGNYAVPKYMDRAECEALIGKMLPA